jgi:hypothetical protein
MTTYFHASDAFLVFMKEKLHPNVTRAVLYSKEGFVDRMLVKKEVERKVEQRTLTLCLLTCGLVICCCGCCGLCDTNEEDLNEDFYCEQMKERHPDKTFDVAFEFTS